MDNKNCKNKKNDKKEKTGIENDQLGENVYGEFKNEVKGSTAGKSKNEDVSK